MSDQLTLGGLFTALNQAGIGLSVKGEQLQLRAPVGAMTPELVAAALQHKATILATLDGIDTSDADERTAIVWCESLNECEGENAVAAAVAEWGDASQATLESIDKEFARMPTADLEYLLRSRPKHYCLRCGGWSEHRADCEAEENQLPWGRYRGRGLRDVPSDYLRWLVQEKQAKLPESLALAIARLLNISLRPKPPAELETSRSPTGQRSRLFAPPSRKGCRPCSHVNWIDELASTRPGWIRTQCGKCRNIIGYRPGERPRPIL